MKDYRGTPLEVGDKVALYWGYNQLQTAEIHLIRGGECKVKVTYNRVRYLPDGREEYTEEAISQWKRGECMIKLPEDTDVRE